MKDALTVALAAADEKHSSAILRDSFAATAAEKDFLADTRERSARGWRNRITKSIIQRLKDTKAQRKDKKKPNAVTQEAFHRFRSSEKQRDFIIIFMSLAAK